MLIYITKFESVNSTDGYQINNKDDINYVKEEDFLMGIFIPFEENCSYKKLLYTFDFNTFKDNIISNDWKPLNKEEILDNSEIVVTKRKEYVINNFTTYNGQYKSIDNLILKHGYGELVINGSIIKCHWCNNKLNYKKDISLELDNKIKITIYENGIISCTLDHPNLKRHCNKFNEWLQYTNYYSNIKNRSKLIKFVLDIIIVDKDTNYYKTYFKILLNSPIEYLIYFKSFYGDCFFGFDKNNNKIKRLNLLGYILFNLKYINDTYGHYYKNEDCKFCKFKTNSISTSCLTYRHDNDPDLDYILKNKKEWINLWNESNLTFNISELFKNNYKREKHLTGLLTKHHQDLQKKF